MAVATRTRKAMKRRDTRSPQSDYWAAARTRKNLRPVCWPNYDAIGGLASELGRGSALGWWYRRIARRGDNRASGLRW